MGNLISNKTQRCSFAMCKIILILQFLTRLKPFNKAKTKTHENFLFERELKILHGKPDISNMSGTVYLRLKTQRLKLFIIFV